MAKAHRIIIAPVITEKSTNLQDKESKYFFRVVKEANKIEIKKAIEEIFGVKVLKVNTMKMPGKKKRVRYREGKTPDWKEAVVTLRKGDKIELL